MVGVYQAHKAIVDFGKLVLVESGWEFGGFGKGEGFMAENGIGSVLDGVRKIYRT